MNKLLAASAVLAFGLAGTAGTAFAADLSAPIVEAPAPMAAPSNMYVQLLGGVAFGLDTDFFFDGDPDGTDDMDMGAAFGVSAGIMVTDNVAVELDYLHTDRNFSDDDDNEGVRTNSFMADAKYMVPVSDNIDLYVGAGVGWIGATEYYTDDQFDYSGFGFQLMAGMAVKVADNISVVGELRYQDGFGALDEEDGDESIDAPIAAALVGLKIGF